MDEKITSILEKALQDKKKGNYQKALHRLSDALDKSPDEIELYLEAADICVEGGEPLQATQFLKKAGARFPAEKNRVDSFSIEKVHASGDPVLAKFLVDQMIKKRDLDSATEVLENLQDRTIRELLQRNRTKKQTLESAARVGHALKGEMVTNLMSEALLCLRLGRMKESVRSFLSILDDKPVENESFEPFFAGLEKKYSKSGRIRYAYACSLIAAQQYDKATIRLVQSVRLEPKIGDDVLDKLRDLAGTFETPPESIQDALVTILLEKGDVLRAGEIMQELLSDQPENAHKVLEFVRPHVGEISDSLLLHYLYMDAALLADQTRHVTETLGKIKQHDAHRDDVFEWLENKSKEQFLPADVMILHGEIAIEVGNADRGLEIFQAIAANAAGDIPALLTVVEKHKNTDERLVDFLAEHATVQQTVSDGGLDLEHFENNEFSFSNGSAQEPVGETGEPDLPEPPAADESSESTSDPEERQADPDTEPTEIEPVTPGSMDIDSEQKPLSPLEKGLEQTARMIARGESSDIIWEEESSGGMFESPGKSDEASPEKISNETDDDSWLEKQSDSVMVTSQEHTERVTGAIELPDESSSESPDEPPDEIPDEPSDEHSDEPSDEIPDESIDEIPEESADETPDEPSEEIPDPFDEVFSRFLDGDLDNESILTLATEALERGMMDEAKELLHFEPVNDEEALARKLSLVWYYTAIERPPSALGIIDTIKLASLAPDTRRDILVKKAACQKLVNDFEGAHTTYRRLTREFPSPDIERMAKRNYERYLQNQCGEDLVLEKTTSLHGYQTKEQER